MLRDSGKAAGAEHEESEIPEIRVRLDVYGFYCSPDEITTKLGIMPTSTWLRGDSVPRTTLQRKENRWIVSAPSSASMSLGDHILRLLEQLKPATSRFALLPSDAKVQVYCVVYDYHRRVILSVPATALASIAALGADLNLDYYDMTDWEEQAE